jgi:glycosyltransferase involved in cell wall biosynthesis
LPWVAHFSDPWADSPFLTDATLRARALTAEQKIVEIADMLVFPVGRVADLVMRKYPSSFAGKVRVVPHGFEPRARRAPRRGDASTPLRLIHAGDFYGIRTPAPLIAALRHLHAREPLDGKIEVVFIGSVPDEHRAAAHAAGLDGVVRFAGRIANAECNALQDTADALLVMDAPAVESVFLPSKLIDYLPFGRPIIGLTPANGASSDLLRELGCPVAEPNDVEAIAEVVETLLAQWQSGKLVAGERFHTVASRYGIAATTALLDQAISDTISS